MDDELILVGQLKNKLKTNDYICAYIFMLVCMGAYIQRSGTSSVINSTFTRAQPITKFILHRKDQFRITETIVSEFILLSVEIIQFSPIDK